MLFHLIRKELLEQLLSLRFAMACIICLVITLSSALVLTRDYSEALDDYQTNVVMHDNELEESGNVWGQGIVVDRPPNVLQIFVRGIERDLTSSTRFTSQQEPQFESNYEGNPVTFLFPPIDMVFFIGVVMSLLAIAFSYDAVSGESEAGTLKVLMSYSVPRDLVLLAKWLGGYLALTAPFLLSVLGALLVVVLFPSVNLRTDDWLALVGLTVAGLMYLSAVYSLGVFVSARTHLASTSITVLLMVWVLMVLVVPNVSPYIAAQVNPLPDFTQIDKEKRERETDLGEAFGQVEEEYAEAHSDIPRWGDDGRWGTWWNKAFQRHMLQVIDAQKSIDGTFANELGEQVALAQQVSRLSPFSSFAYAAAELSGGGLQGRARFMDSLLEYRRQFTIYVTDLWCEAWRQQKQNERRDVSGRPRFTLEAVPTGARVAESLIDVLILGVWSVVFFMGAYLSFLRYDVK